MKFGQLLSFIVEALPPEAQQALATLQSDAPPMAPAAAAAVVRAELGADPEKVFLDWQPTPVAAASVGQVHRAVTRDGVDVAVKVQYPGVGDAIHTDLDNAEGLYRLVGAFALKGSTPRHSSTNSATRMIDELDYRLEARTSASSLDAFADHPFVRIPAVDTAHSTERVLTTEWVDGIGFDEFLATADRAGEAAAPASRSGASCSTAVHAAGGVQRRPASGQLPLRHDGQRHVPRLRAGEALATGRVGTVAAQHWTRWSCTAIPERLVAAMEAVGFLQPGHGLAPEAVFDYVSAPYLPYQTERFTFTRDFVKDALATIIDVKGPHAAVIEQLNMPASFVILDRVVWGVNAILGKLEVEAPWRAMLLEYLVDAPAATPARRGRSSPGAPPPADLATAR